MKIRKGRFSGTLGQRCTLIARMARWSGAGPAAGARRPADWPPAQYGRVAQVWRKLTGKQYDGLEAAAKKVDMKAYPFFCKINGALVAARLPLLMDPPKPEKIRPNPVGELEILNRGGVITLRLRVPRAPAKHTFVLGSRWCSRGIWTRGNRFAITVELPAAAGGWMTVMPCSIRTLRRELRRVRREVHFAPAAVRCAFDQMPGLQEAGSPSVVLLRFP